MNPEPSQRGASSLRRRIVLQRQRLERGESTSSGQVPAATDRSLDVVESIDPSTASSDHFCEAFGTLPPVSEATLFLDLETTGLGGESLIFLVGLLHREGEIFRLRQWYCQDVVAEGKALQRLGDELAQRPTVVTYNGDTFDLPFIERRMRFHRLAGLAKELASVDLLRMVRSRYRPIWPDCRLATAESRLLRKQRSAVDVPGREAPIRFQDFKAGGPKSLIEPVIYHNRIDLTSLVALLPILSSLDDSKGAPRDAIFCTGGSN